MGATALPRGFSGTIRDIKHVVILRQENRSFDHYFGTLRGVRGFGDKQILTYRTGPAFALADAFTICDGYHQSIMAPTSPNRMYLWTGTSSGFITNPDDYIVDFGPDAGPAEATTYPEQLQAAGVSWQVYTNDQVGDSGFRCSSAPRGPAAATSTPTSTTTPRCSGS